MLKKFCEDLRLQYFHYKKNRKKEEEIEKVRDINWQVVLCLYLVFIKFEEIIDIRKEMIAEKFDIFSKLQKSFISLRYENGLYGGSENNYKVSPVSKKILSVKYSCDFIMNMLSQNRVEKAKEKSREYIALFFREMVDKYKIRDGFNNYTLQSIMNLNLY